MFLKRCKKHISLVLVFSIIMTLFAFFATNVSATDEYIIDGHYYIIKNVFSGKYLDVDHAQITNGTNVLQWQYHGGDNQEWKIVNVQGSLYKIVSCLNTNKALTVVNTTGNNGVNITISDYVGTVAQHFVLRRTSKTSYQIITNASGYNSAVTVENASCNNGANVFQWFVNGSLNGEWFIEPALSYSSKAGVDYAVKNSKEHNITYPDFSDFNGGTDCTNFVSQCLVAGGIHYTDQWYVNKKNSDNLKPTTIDQINSTWSLADPSPWISAKYFNNFWTSKKIMQESYLINDILADPSIIYNRPFYTGDVVQVLNHNILFGAADAVHSVYITGYGTDNSQSTYLYSGHNNDRTNASLLALCRYYKNNGTYYLRFFHFE